MAKQQNNPNTRDFDFSPYWQIYLQAKVLYSVMIQGRYLVFDSKLKAEKYLQEVKEMRGLEGEIREIVKSASKDKSND